LRAALNELAAAAPDWLRGAVPAAWSKRYARRVEDGRRPRTAAERQAYARTVGADGFALLDLLDRPGAPAGLQRLPKVQVLRRVWARHFERDTTPPAGDGGGGVRLRPKGELPPAAAGIESPYDPEARYRRRGAVGWAGYVVHLTETCDDEAVHLLTHAMTTAATVHEARCTATIHRALVAKGLPPGEHLVDAAYIDAELLVRGREELDIALVGPPRRGASWQERTAGAYAAERFAVDWRHQRAHCPQGRASSSWREYTGPGRGRFILVGFRAADCRACPARALCTRAERRGRQLLLQPRARHEALRAARASAGTEAGRRLYAKRAGIEGTLSQGVRALGLRRARYRGLAKAHLQHGATAAAINLERLGAWFRVRPRAATRTSRFAALAA
jgi:transposase